ncbi:Origin recognition complex subunit 3, partial [Coemansia brasiliensis]
AAQLLVNPENIANVATLSGEPSKRIRTRTDMEERPFLLFDSNISDAQLQALEKCCEAIETMLKVCLRSYHDVPLNEVFYYRHSFLLDATFSAQPRAAVQTALGRSHYYINCNCCSETPLVSSGDVHNSDDEDHRVLPTMHDTSIAYRLHQECGRLINLYDWHSAFSSVIEREPSRAAPSQAEIQARFMRSVEEMRFLGFIKSTQRKTDHVVRLTWGIAPVTLSTLSARMTSATINSKLPLVPIPWLEPLSTHSPDPNLAESNSLSFASLDSSLTLSEVNSSSLNGRHSYLFLGINDAGIEALNVFHNNNPI